MNAVYGLLGWGARLALGLGMILAALSTPAWALSRDVPEIDPGSMASALTLLTGGMLMLTERKRRR